MAHVLRGSQHNFRCYDHRPKGWLLHLHVRDKGRWFVIPRMVSLDSIRPLMVTECLHRLREIMLVELTSTPQRTPLPATTNWPLSTLRSMFHTVRRPTLIPNWVQASLGVYPRVVTRYLVLRSLLPSQKRGRQDRAKHRPYPAASLPQSREKYPGWEPVRLGFNGL